MLGVPDIFNLMQNAQEDAYNQLHNFGLGIHPRQLSFYRPNLHNAYNSYNPIRYRQQLARRNINQGQQIGKDGFQASLDVAHFQPNELNVKVVGNSIVVEGKHEERQDEYGYIERHFVRRYVLPKGYDSEMVTSALSSDGILTISAPKPAPVELKSKERIVQIQQTGPAHLNIAENAEENQDEPSADGGNDKNA